MNTYTRLVIFLGLTLTWVAIFKSTDSFPVPQGDIQAYFENRGPLPVAGIGGWPFPTFHYPPSPLGGDIPPVTSVYPFIMNWIFWSLVVAAVLWFVPKRLITGAVLRVVNGLTILTSLGGLMFLLLKFD
ncbi:MAG: hypothetical protein HY975_04035 [Candidatus Kerfeldbacteria bacterium]|nr:hypothetical protein [Candidatus Kerfeldbacteria bacterium]